MHLRVQCTEHIPLGLCAGILSSCRRQALRAPLSMGAAVMAPASPAVPPQGADGPYPLDQGDVLYAPNVLTDKQARAACWPAPLCRRPVRPCLCWQ